MFGFVDLEMCVELDLYVEESSIRFFWDCVIEDFDFVENVIFCMFWKDVCLFLKYYYEDVIKLKDVLELDEYLEWSGGF